jgi:hypothetical protein
MADDIDSDSSASGLDHRSGHSDTGNESLDVDVDPDDSEDESDTDDMDNDSDAVMVGDDSE